MPTILDRMRQTIRDHALARPGTRVVVALSGGSDSVALARLVHQLDASGELSAAGLAHFNHQLRPAADSEEQSCRDLAASMGWPIEIEREDVASRARREHRSLEDAAHRARYEFLERARCRLRADVVALGHTRDDQAETFLLRLMRGAGARGLAAMSPLVGAMIRPLLDCRRSELRAYLAETGIPYIEDESNADVSIPRNRVRAELLPLLESRFNPSIVEVLADNAALAREEWCWMQAAADQLRARVATRAGPAWELEVAPLAAAPVALQRLVLWQALTDTGAGRPVSFDHVEAARRLLHPAAGDTGFDGPGQRVERVGPQIVLRGRPLGATGRPSVGEANLFWFPLSIPGEVRLPEAGWAVSAELLQAGGAPPSPALLAEGGSALVRGELSGARLAVRNRRPGDRFRPVGVGGRKKLQDFFVDRKVPRAHRDAIPLVVDEQDRIVWVAGYGIDEVFQVTDPTQAVVILRLKLLGGVA